MKLDIWTKAPEPPPVGHNPPPSKEEKNFILMMDDIFKRQTEEAVKNVKKVIKGELTMLLDKSKWDKEVADLTEGLRFRPFKRGGDAGIAQLFKIRKQFRLAEWIEAPEVLQALREETFQFARTIDNRTANDLQTALLEGVKAGESIPLIERRIVAVNEAWRDSRRSMMIARTETSRAYTQGQLQAWEQTGVVSEKEWSAASDACPFCLSMNGKSLGLRDSYFNEGDPLSIGVSGGRTATMKMGYGSVEGPPLHPNCRCAIVAHIQDAGGMPIGAEVIKPMVSGRGPKPIAGEIKPLEFKNVDAAKKFFESDLGMVENLETVLAPGRTKENLLKNLGHVGSEWNRLLQYDGLKKVGTSAKIKNLIFINTDTVNSILKKTDVAGAGRLLGAYSRGQKKMWLSNGLGPRISHKIDEGTWMCGGDVGSAARHEFGHLYFDKLPPKMQSSWIDKTLVKNEINFDKLVSKYAGSDFEEAFAESFSAYTSTLYKKGTLPSWVEKFMDNFIGG